MPDRPGGGGPRASRSGGRSDRASARSFRAVALAAVVTSGAAWAQDDETVEARREEARDRIVVTGTAVPVAVDKIGASLTVIDEGLIEDQGYAWAPDVLRQVPGVAVNRAGSFGGLTQVRIRGGESNHTLVLLDGIDVSSPDQGETDFSTLLAGDIARIEVLRGPQSGLYGSNALSGVVNIITRRDIDGSYVDMGLEAGELGTFQLQGAAGVGDGETYASVGLHRLRTDGYDISPDTTAQGVPAVGRRGRPGDPEGHEVVTAYARAGKALTPQARIDGVARYLDRTAQLDGQAFGFPIAGRTYDDASEMDTTQLLLGGSGALALLDGRWETVASASRFDEQRRGVATAFPFLSAPPTPEDLDVPLLPANGADATRTTLALRSTLQLARPGLVSHLTGFAEREEETYRNPFPASPAQGARQERALVGAGAELRLEIADQLYLSGALRHDDNDAFEDADTWSLAASWVVPGAGARPHASFGAGVTNPTFFEQFGFDPRTFVGNPDLMPEEAEGWEIGLEQTFRGGLAVLDVTYFQSTLENEIVTTFGPPPDFVSTPSNSAERSERRGWEASLRLFPTPDIDILGSYTRLDATEPAGIEVRRPEHQAALDAIWRLGGGPLQLNLGVAYNGEQADTDFAAFSLVEMDAYTLVRVGAAHRLSDAAEVYARVENALDEDYEEVLGFRGAPRAAFVGVRMRAGAGR